MAFFLIIGMKFITWGSDRMAQPMQCPNCNTYAPFKIKKGMRFITLFFVIPVIPISGVKTLVECPTCGARFEHG